MASTNSALRSAARSARTRKRRRHSPPRAWSVPPQPPRAHPARASRASLDATSANPRSSPEEVAQLAGLGVTWYTWLEQGRDIHASAQVLDAIARTLQFDAHEHSHLFTLAGVATTTIANECFALCPTVQPLIDQLEPFPASVVNSRLDLLAYNRTYASFFPTSTRSRSKTETPSGLPSRTRTGSR